MTDTDGDNLFDGQEVNGFASGFSKNGYLGLYGFYGSPNMLSTEPEDRQYEIYAMSYITTYGITIRWSFFGEQFTKTIGKGVFFTYKTDPKNNDTDGDGLWDGWKDDGILIGYWCIDIYDASNQEETCIISAYEHNQQWDYYDRNGNNQWDLGEPCEVHGEVGDPMHKYANGLNKGSILSLISNGDPSENPNPRKKDIYVEINWMFGLIYTTNVGAGPSTRGVGPADPIIDSHKPSVDDINRLIDRFKYAPIGNVDPADTGITLHIIDGGPISHRDPVTLNEYELSFNGLMFMYGHYFKTERHHIFHYCVSSHYYSAGHNVFGVGLCPGNLFAIFGQAIEDYSSYYAKHFIHELGHNFGLYHPSDNYNPTVMYTSMYQGVSNIVNYGTNPHAQSFYLGVISEIPNGDEWQFVAEHMGDGL